MNNLLCLTSFLTLLSSAATAEEIEVQTWAHGAWHVRQYQHAGFDFYGCEVWTGGDGAGVVSIDVNDGGADASLDYTPVAYRGLPAPLTLDDQVALIFDGQVSAASEAMEVMELENEWQEWIVSAGIFNFMIAETVQDMRAANTLEVGVARNGALTVYDTYPLTGFTATWLKASEWCRFDPDKAFISRS